ncbi:MAG: hypothetical protein AAB493_01520, partial [Patescibacteria group bacterium]
MQKFVSIKAFTGIMLMVLLFSFFFSNTVFAVAGVPTLLHHQGRLLNSSGSLLGGSSGTNYCFKFSLYDNATPPGGTKLWPSGAPTKMTVNVKNGILNVDIGDTSVGGEGNALDFDFNSTDEVYLNIQVADSSGGSCAGVADGSYENLSPRSRVVSAGYAINSKTVGGFTPSQTPTGSQIPVLSLGNLTFGDAATISTAAGTGLTLDSGTTGALNIGTGSNAKMITIGNTTTTTSVVLTKGGTGNITLTGFNCSTLLNGGALTTDASGNIICSGDDATGGGSTLQSIYDTASGNTILTTTARNVAFTLGEVVTPTSFTIENQDTAGVSAQRIFNSIASLTLTNGLLVEQTGAGTMTNAIQVLGTAGAITNGLLIADGAGTITNGIQLTGTFTTTLLDTPSLDITAAGNITGAGTIGSGAITSTGIVSGTQLTSTITTGTAPFVVASTTPVANLSIGGNAATVTNATLTTALTVNTGTLTLTANVANTSVLTIGAGASSVSGSNTGDQTSVTGNAGTVTFADAAGDTTTFVALGTAATGSLAPATDAGLTYDATANALTATTFIGALTGNASGSAATVTGAAQTAITSLGTLTG